MNPILLDFKMILTAIVDLAKILGLPILFFLFLKSLDGSSPHNEEKPKDNNKSKVDKEASKKAYKKAYKKGYKDGYKDGFDDGETFF